MLTEYRKHGTHFFLEMSSSLQFQNQSPTPFARATTTPNAPLPKFLAQWSIPALQVTCRIAFAAPGPLRQIFAILAQWSVVRLGRADGSVCANELDFFGTGRTVRFNSCLPNYFCYPREVRFSPWISLE